MHYFISATTPTRCDSHLKSPPIATISEAMSKKSEVKSTKNALKSSKLENCFEQECKIVCYCSHKENILYL